ncbi:Oidioi.mRNA.OKI2018_I69.chr1.g2985.t1.cds [Oikopleura dioica]|uniref:Oidioi.mRNA.OKI2018_I69.chr1.g2985.t1.cds n=1 Tax=Oikopleura dioica TaxID=34765 RepID=A0ABN7SWN1_OIKDI|nr:Oidioi.mRNA.OKI2018_I69.chr1.g2985.t1.cds [Oikopleura dioica]
MIVTIKDFDFHTANKGGVFYIDATVISNADKFFPDGFSGEEIELRLPIRAKHELEVEFLHLLEFRHTKKELLVEIEREALQTLSEQIRNEPKAYIFRYASPFQPEKEPSHDCPVCGQENVFKSTSILGWNLGTTPDDDVITQSEQTGTIYIDGDNQVVAPPPRSGTSA